MSPDPAGCQPVRTHIRRTFNNGGEASVARLRGAHLARSKGMHGVLGGLLRGLRALRAVRLELTQRVVRLSTQLGDELVRCRGGGSRHVPYGVVRDHLLLMTARLLAAPRRLPRLPRTGRGAGGNGANFMLHDINLASRPPTASTPAGCTARSRGSGRAEHLSLRVNTLVPAHARRTYRTPQERLVVRSARVGADEATPLLPRGALTARP